MIQFESERDPLDVLAEDFAARCRKGEAPSVGEYVTRYPEWADQLQALLPPVATLEQLKLIKRLGQRAAAEEDKPARIGDYRIVREVGRGGMGIVYEAEHEALGRRVALKVLPRHALLDAKKLQRFQREARAAARLHHTNIVPVFGVGEQDGLHFYVMQFIEGQGLNELISGWRRDRTSGEVLQPTEPVQQAGDNRRAGAQVAESDAFIVQIDEGLAKARWAEIACIGMQAAEALQYAHQQGICHRDIKPANLLLDMHGTLWIADFGLAKLTGENDLTASGDILGTLNYMAPESLEAKTDTRSDIYSLGLTLYELLTLAPPFDAVNPGQLIHALNSRAPTRPRKLEPAMPRDLETIVLKAIARDPGQRYQNAQELADDLQCFLDDRPIRARRAGIGERLGRWTRRNRAVAALGAIAASAILLAAVVGWVGYARTAAALDGESRKSALAQAATLGAEANVELSLRQFEDLFNTIAARESNVPLRTRFVEGRPARPMPQFEEEAELLKSVLTFYERFAEQNTTNTRLRREAAKAYRRVGEIHQRLGQFDKGAAAYLRAATLYENLLMEFPRSQEDRYFLAESYARAGGGFTGKTDLVQAEALLRKALAIETALKQEAPVVARLTSALARNEHALGAVLQQIGNLEDAEKSYRHALTLYKELGKPAAGLPGNILDRVAVRQSLGLLLLKRDRPAEARALLGDAIGDLENSRAALPRERIAQPLLVTLHRNLATILNCLGEKSLAATASLKAEELSRGITAFTIPNR